MRQILERTVLLGPALLRRTAAGQTVAPEQRWMLEQPKEVRRSYVREVMDAPGEPEIRTQIWMMRQPDTVRESYVVAVLEPHLGERSA